MKLICAWMYLYKLLHLWITLFFFKESKADAVEYHVTYHSGPPLSLSAATTDSSHSSQLLSYWGLFASILRVFLFLSATTGNLQLRKDVGWWITPNWYCSEPSSIDYSGDPSRTLASCYDLLLDIDFQCVAFLLSLFHFSCSFTCASWNHLRKNWLVSVSISVRSHTKNQNLLSDNKGLIHSLIQQRLIASLQSPRLVACPQIANNLLVMTDIEQVIISVYRLVL